MRSKFAIVFVVGALAATAVCMGYTALQDGQVGEAAIELQRVRQRTLSNLAGFMSNPNAAGVRVGALRVLCSEIPVELALARNSGEEFGQRRILAVQPFCEPG